VNVAVKELSYSLTLCHKDWLNSTAKRSYGQKKRSQGGKTKYTPAYSLNEILEGRKNYKAYSQFLSYFGPCLGKKTNWRDRVMKATSDNEILSRSSEAFGLLLLENQWDRWFDIYCMHDGRITSKRGQKRAKCDSKIMPKYTRGGITYISGTNVKEDSVKGWSNAGIHRFNELYDFVKNDRKANKGFLFAWLKEEREKYGKKKRKKTPVESAPAAKHELFSDNEEEMMQSPVSSTVLPSYQMVTPALSEEKEKGNESDQERYEAKV